MKQKQIYRTSKNKPTGTTLCNKYLIDLLKKLQNNSYHVGYLTTNYFLFTKGTLHSL